VRASTLLFRSEAVDRLQGECKQTYPSYWQVWWYNKRLKELTLCLPKAERDWVTKRMERIGRRNRLYRAKNGKIICADVSGSYNILRKCKPDAFTAEGLAAYVVQPGWLAITV
jgi:hypothetical protein